MIIYVQLRLPFSQLFIREGSFFLQRELEKSHGNPVMELVWVMCIPWTNHCGQGWILPLVHLRSQAYSMRPRGRESTDIAMSIYIPPNGI